MSNNSNKFSVVLLILSVILLDLVECSHSLVILYLMPDIIHENFDSELFFSFIHRGFVYVSNRVAECHLNLARN